MFSVIYSTIILLLIAGKEPDTTPSSKGKRGLGRSGKNGTTLEEQIIQVGIGSSE